MSTPRWRAFARPTDLASPPPGVCALVETLQAHGHEAWLVGGGVRDRLLGLPVHDWDVATQAEPEQVQALFERVYSTGLAHGTVTVLCEDTPVEVTTYRVEGGYSDGRHPDEVHFTRCLIDDLSRRDFTVNALAWDPGAGLIVDAFGGLDDLARGLLRCVGAAEERFAEDGLRALRAVRFIAVLGFELDDEAQRAIASTLDTFARIAVERVRVELLKLLCGRDALRGLQLLQRTGLLGATLPHLAQESADFEAALRLVPAAPRTEAARWAALLWGCPAQADETLRTLRCANAERKAVLALLSLRSERGLRPSALEPHSDAEVRQLLAQIGRTHYEAWCALWAAAQAVGLAAGVSAFTARVAAIGALQGALSVRDLALDGRAVAQLIGEPPSWRIGWLLDGLLQRVWAEPEGNTVAQLSAWLPQLVRALPETREEGAR